MVIEVPAIFKIALQNTDELTMSDTAKRPKAVGVIFKDENGNQHQAFLAERRGSEIILSCGAIGSPQMLMLSGIGPKAELKKFNISVVLNNRFVGKGLSDNPLNTVFVPTDRPVEQSLIQTVGITKRGVYIEASSGFGQSSDSIRYDHGMMSAEVSIGVLLEIDHTPLVYRGIRKSIELTAVFCIIRLGSSLLFPQGKEQHKPFKTMQQASNSCHTRHSWEASF